jgi:HEAT repeat protein
MSLELGAAGVLLDRTIDRIVDEGRVNALLDLVAAPPPDSTETVDAIMNRLTHPETIARLVASEPVDFVSLDRLMPSLSIDAHRVLIGALANTEQRRTRRKLLDRLVRTHADIAALAIERLNDERWFVQRNMLILLHGTGRVPSSFSAVPWTTHSHPHVRYEAIRLQLTIGRERSRALRAALAEEDPRFVRLGLAALQQECPPELVAVVTRVANDSNASEQLRTLAVQALGRSRNPQALETLLVWLDGGTTLFGRPRLPASTPFVLAALSALRQGWSTDRRASVLLALASASDDPKTRHAATQAGV